MARISTYDQDNSLNKLDKLIGTDSATDGTKNFTISSLIQLINDLTAINFFDGLSYEFKDYDADATDPQGILNITGTSSITTPFANITQLILSKKGDGSPDIENYIRALNGSTIKISEQGDIDNFGIYKITDINNHDNDRYLRLTLSNSQENGSLTVGSKYFFSSYQASVDSDLSERNVTEFGDVNSAGSGSIVTNAERDIITTALVHNDVVDNLTSTSASVPLSANQGRVLNNLIAGINNILTSDNSALDTLQEIVDYVEANRSTLNGLAISNIAGLQSALNAKQNTEAGKGLSTNDFTDALLDKLDNIAAGAQVNVQTDWNGSGDAAILNKPNNFIYTSSSVTDLNDVLGAGSGYIITDAERQKLDNIAAGAEVNVQADWNATAGDSFIQNKPTSVTAFTDVSSAGSGQIITGEERTKLEGIAAGAQVNPTSVTAFTDVSNAGSGQIITGDERSKLEGIAANAEVNVNADWNATTGDAEILNKPALAPSNAQQNVQSNWDESNTESDAFIQNKPNLSLKADKSTTITVQGTANEIEVSPDTAQDLSANRTITVGLPDDVTIGDDLTVTNKVNLGGPMEFTGVEATTPTFDNGLYYSTDDNHDTLHFRYHGHDLSIDYLTQNIPTGILAGGELAKVDATTFSIAAGDGVINILNKGVSDPHPEIKKVSWSAQNITHTQGDANNADQLNTWVYINSSGTVVQSTTVPGPSVYRDNIVLGSIIHASNTIIFTKTFPRTSYSTGNTYAEFAEIFGPLKKSGHNLTVNTTNTLALDRAQGVSFALGRNYVNDPENPSIVDDAASTPTFHRYSSTSTGFTKDDGDAGAGYASIDPSKYDNNGTLTSMQTSKFSVQRLYHFPNNTNTIVAYYGKNYYDSIDAAEKNYLLEDFKEADNTSTQAIYLGALIVKGDATDLGNSGQAKILTGGIFRSLAAVNAGGVAADAALGDLTDVDTAGAQDGEGLVYVSANGRWEPGEVSTDLTPITLDTTNNRVGINNTVPAVELDVNGDMQLYGTAPRFVLKETGSNDDYSLRVYSNGRLAFLNNNTASETMSLLQNGNLGLGTTSPTYKLNVHEASDTDVRIQLSNGGTGTGAANGFQIIANGSSAGYQVNLLQREDGPLALWTNNTERLRITGDGAIEIKGQGSGNTFIGDDNAGNLGTVTGTSNTGFGYNTLGGLTTGASNTAFGAYALDAITTATGNVAIGTYSQGLSTASGNTSVGHGSQSQNTTGSENVALGNSALYYNQTGARNTAIGYRSMVGSSGNSPLYNTAVGWKSLQDITNGQHNVGVGMSVLENLTTGDFNTVIGNYAAMNLTTQNHNIAIGYLSMSNAAGASTTQNIMLGYQSGKNLTSSSNVGIGHNALLDATGATANVAIGTESLTNLTEGDYNTAVGYASLDNATTGERNVGVGYLSLDNVTDGGRNTAIGMYSGRTKSDGTTAVNPSRSVYIGYNATSGSSDTTPFNEMVIGYNAIGNGDNTATYGNSAILKHIFPNDVYIEKAGTGSFIVDATEHASIVIDRGSTTYDANLAFRTAGATKWRLWLDGSDNTFGIRDEANSNQMVTFKTGGYTGIGITDPQKPLHVNGTIRLTSGSYGDWDFDRYYGLACLVAPNATSAFHFGTSANPSAATLTPVHLGKLGVGTTSPAASVDIATTDAIIVPKGTTTERPSTPEAGMFRYNTTDGQFEGYTTEWGAIAGSGGGGSTAFRRDTFTGNGTQTAYTLGAAPASEDVTFVYIQGVYQEKSTYSVSGSTITFTTAPQNGYTFEVMSLTSVDISASSHLETDSFTGTGSQTSFTLVNGSPTNKSFTMVYISGVYQQKSTYSLTSGAIVFGTAPDVDDVIEVVSFSAAGVTGSSTTDANDARYNVEVISTNQTASAGSVYVFTASLTLTLPASPAVGESIKISNLSDTETCVLGRNGNKILGVAEDLTLDTASASFELIYSGTNKGWVIIGQ